MAGRHNSYQLLPAVMDSPPVLFSVKKNIEFIRGRNRSPAAYGSGTDPGGEYPVIAGYPELQCSRQNHCPTRVLPNKETGEGLFQYVPACSRPPRKLLLLSPHKSPLSVWILCCRTPRHYRRWQKLKAAVYCRVSTEDQAESKTIGNQVEFARKYFDLNGLEIFGFYLDEGVSGTVPVERRPEGSRMLADARRGCFGAVYVYRLDRLARTALDILKTHHKLAEARVALRSMTENFDTSTPSGKFFMTTLGGIAEIERETIAERMSLGKDRALREGRWPGGPPPYGYSLANRRLAVNPAEARVVRKIFRLYVRGEMTTVAIADYLNATGVSSPGTSGKGGHSSQCRWHGSRVWAILSNPVYRGTFHRRGGGGTVELTCPPLVPEGEWRAARELLGKNSLDAGRNSRRDYLLKGLARCGLCGRSYCGDGSGRSGRHSYYRCAGSTSARGGTPRCPSMSVRADILEGIVWSDVCKYLLSAGQLVVGVVDRVSPGVAMPRDGDEAAVIEAAARARERERKRIISLFRKEIITEDEAAGELSRISRELEALEKRRKTITGREELPGDSAGAGCLLGARLESAGCREKRDLVRGLVDCIVVDTAAGQGKAVPRVTIYYVFDGSAGSALVVETRGKYRLGVPKSPY